MSLLTCMIVYMRASILYPSRLNSSDYPSGKPLELLYISPYGLRIIFCVRAPHITEPTWVGLGPIEQMKLILARDQIPGSCGASWLLWARARPIAHSRYVSPCKANVAMALPRPSPCACTLHDIWCCLQTIDQSIR